MKISKILFQSGATIPTRALKTSQVIKLVNDENRIVYQELVHDSGVRRIDMEVSEDEDPSGIVNAWYAVE